MVMEEVWWLSLQQEQDEKHARGMRVLAGELPFEVRIDDLRALRFPWLLGVAVRTGVGSLRIGSGLIVTKPNGCFTRFFFHAFRWRWQVRGLRIRRCSMGK